MWQHLKRALEEFAQIKLKSMFMPRGCRVLHLKIRRPSTLRLSLVLWRPARTTATIISSVVWPGEEKCLATGRSAFFETDLRCSQNLSPSLRPVSPTYDRVHAGQVMIYTRLLVVHENLCRMVKVHRGVLIWETGLASWTTEQPGGLVPRVGVGSFSNMALKKEVKNRVQFGGRDGRSLWSVLV